MSELQRYTLSVGQCVDGPCLCETTDNPDGKYMRSEDVEVDREADKKRIKELEETNRLLCRDLDEAQKVIEARDERIAEMERVCSS